MRSTLIPFVAAIAALGSIAGAQTTRAAPGPLEGSLAEAAETLAADVERSPNDDRARLALGMAQSLRAAERMAGSLYKFGLRDKGLGEMLPFLRMPVPTNPDPTPVSADDLDAILATFVDDLAVAGKTLAQVDDPNVKLPVRVGLIQVDLNGDAPGGAQPAWQAIQGLGFLEQASKEDAEGFVIDFDLGDARWLEGYTHLLSSLASMAQAYEKKEIVERTGHLFFDKVKSPYNAIASGAKVFEVTEGVDAVDAIAFIHLLNLPVRDEAKMRSARGHLLETLRCSRASWAAIRAEADDDREWIPNERQQTVVPRTRPMTAETIDGWLRFVDDCDAALNGKTLIPFWRDAAAAGADERSAASSTEGVGRDLQPGDAAAQATTREAAPPPTPPRVGTGINLMRVFEQPRPFDLVLWVQGTAAAPYLEQGTLANGDSYQRLERLLQGDFFTFAVWVN